VGRAFSPLDRLLHLRQDRWSEGAARVGLRLSLSAGSFARAAENYTDAVGASTSGTSLWRLTQRCGKQLSEHRKVEAKTAFAPVQREEPPAHRRIAPAGSLAAQRANLSTDGGMVHIRSEGWKEVKLSAISAVKWVWDEEQETEVVHLSQHSYTASLATADDFAPYQYAEGMRREIDQTERLSSVNDGAGWISRITELNFPHAIQILDWYHAKSRLITVALTLWPSSERRQESWLDEQLSHLHRGEVDNVIHALDQLYARTESDVVRTAAGYFQENRQRMDYQRFRQLGLPIGSGTVESGVQQVIQHRMHRPGRGWKRECATGMLFLLCEYHGNRFRQTWRQLFA
jgi:hypothetical protein